MTYAPGWTKQVNENRAVQKQNDNAQESLDAIKIGLRLMRVKSEVLKIKLQNGECFDQIESEKKNEKNLKESTGYVRELFRHFVRKASRVEAQRGNSVILHQRAQTRVQIFWFFFLFSFSRKRQKDEEDIQIYTNICQTLIMQHISIH